MKKTHRTWVGALMAMAVVAAPLAGCSKPAPPPGAPKDAPTGVSVDMGNETAPKDAPAATTDSPGGTTPSVPEQGEPK